MSETPSEDFEAHRGHLFAIAYRMLGSVAEAEDAVQEAWLRWSARSVEGGDAIASPRAFLSTVVTRLCLDQLKSAHARRERYVGPWLPEPMHTAAPATDEERDPRALSLAFLVLLERLSPTERAAYLLHQVFEYSHAEVAGILGKDEPACRQLVHRARSHLVENRPRYTADPEAHRRLLEGFLVACAAGDLAALARLLADDVVAFTDGGGKVHAALKPVRGAERVARFFVGVSRKDGARYTPELALVNGELAFVGRVEGRAAVVLTVHSDGERIHAVYVVSNPDKLARFA